VSCHWCDPASNLRVVDIQFWIQQGICLGFAVVVCQINITRTSSSNCCINIPFSVARFDKLYSDTLVEPSKVKLLINTIILDDRPRKIRSQTWNLWTDAATVVGRGCFREGRKVGCRLAKEAGAEPGWASKKCTRLWREATSRSTFRNFPAEADCLQNSQDCIFRIRQNYKFFSFRTQRVHDSCPCSFSRSCCFKADLDETPRFLGSILLSKPCPSGSLCV